MKHLLSLAVCLLVVLFAGCSSKSKQAESDANVLLLDSMQRARPQAMQTSETEVKISYKGKEYSSVVVRRPDAALPIVKNEQGEEFVDNSICLRIATQGKQLVEKVFTKESFAAIIEAKFLKNAILEGMVYDTNTPQGLIYAASVCYPQTDLYIPIRITVTPQGTISMAREELMGDLQPTDSL